MSGALSGELLRAVSRSFYLTIALLPARLREPVGLAYLLARSSDTIADSEKIEPAVRMECLGDFLECVCGNEGSISGIQRRIEPASPGETALIARLDECLAALRATDAEDRERIVAVVETIVRGQKFDLERFTGPGEVHALQTAEELYGYAYLVAGCVGDFWTRICHAHIPRYSSLPIDPLVQLGVNFGKGLQLVNILRDAPEDLRAGRCYLPAEQLRAAGTTPEELISHPERARPVADRWRRIAARHLDDAARYIEAIRPMRLRLACFLPWYLGLRTLALLAENPSLESRTRVKVGRGEVRAALALGPLAVCSNAALRRISGRLSDAASRR